jgi:hypothetical protein
MATANEILVEIAAYTAANGRPCPAKHLTEKFGADAVSLIASLKSEGKIYGKRGRTGGLLANEAPATDSGVQVDAGESSTVEAPAPVADIGDSLAAEFAALAAKLAEQDTATAANG